MASAPGLDSWLSDIRREDHPRVMLEFSELSFVDSAGVSVLIKAKKEAEGSRRTVPPAPPTAQVHRVFALVGLVDWLVFESDERLHDQEPQGGR